MIQEIITLPSNFHGLLYKPVGYSTFSGTYPLLVFCHGSLLAGTDPTVISSNSLEGGPAYFIEQGQWPSSFTNPITGVQENFLVFSPQAPGWSFSANWLNVFVQFMVSTYKVDPNRIHITGLSAGGQSAVDYAGHIDNGNSNTPVVPLYKPASIVPMSMAESPFQILCTNTIADGTHAWGFGSESDSHGVATHLYISGPYAGNSGCTGIGALGKFTSYVGGHCCWNQFYNPTYKENSMSIYEWMLQFVRGSSTTTTTTIAPTTTTTTTTVPTTTTTTTTLAPTTTTTTTTVAPIRTITSVSVAFSDGTVQIIT